MDRSPRSPSPSSVTPTPEMPLLTQVLSAPTLKPYRCHQIYGESPCFDQDGYVDFCEGDVENPRNWSVRRRWYITGSAVFLVLNGNLASSLPSGAAVGIAEEFGVSELAAGLTVTLFLLGYCVGPFVFAPISEFYGRRWIFYVTFSLYMAFNLLCAFTPAFSGLLIGRFLTGTFASASLTNVPGVLADLWDPTERGFAMAIFSLVVWVGPSLGPIIAGFCEMTLGWRWGFYVLLWLGAVAWLFMLVLPETHAPTILDGKAKRARRAKTVYQGVRSRNEAENPELRAIYKVALTRPWAILFDLIASVCALYMGFVYLLQYMLFSIYPIVFQDMRGWNPGVGQLPLIGTIIGAFLGAAIVFLDTRRRRRLLDSGVELIPEDRLLIAKVGGVGFPVTMFWFAWTANFNSVHWIVPTLAGTFLSTCLILIFVAYTNYFVDSYVGFAASAVAVNTFARSVGSAAAPLFTNAMFEALGVGGGGSLIGGVAAMLAVIPFVFSRYGYRIRKNSKYCVGDGEPKPREEVEAWDEERGRPDFGEVEARQHEELREAEEAEAEEEEEEGESPGRRSGKHQRGGSRRGTQSTQSN